MAKNSVKIGKKKKEKSIIGWREWVGLPDLGIDAVRAKIDTGAKTSAIHAFDLVPFERDGEQWIAFSIHPRRRKKLPSVACEARVMESRKVTSSNGIAESRYVIETSAIIGSKRMMIELTLTNRDELSYRMLVGREALRGRFLVHSRKSYLQGDAGPGKFKEIEA